MLSMLKKLWPISKRKQKSGFYFIHIPKTAGTSFINLLDSYVNQTEIFPHQLWHQINQDSVEKKDNYQLLRGHFGGGSYKLLSSGNPHTLTILRHPQSLSISTYHFIKREKNTAVHDLVTNNDMDLQAFLEEPLTALKINNRMVRHLSFDLQEDPEAQELFLSTQSIKVVNSWIGTPKTITNKQRLERAKTALDTCSWFGIQEKFDESMQLFAYRFNRPPVGKTPYLNAHKPDQEISKKCKSLIAQQNQEDLALYTYAMEKFTQKYNAMCTQLTQKYGANLTIDEMIDQHYLSSYHSISEKGLNYEFGMELLGNGWHRRELAQPENTFFRWTSRNNASIDFWLMPQDYQIHIRIINAISIYHLTKLVLLINGTTTSYTFDLDEGVVRIISLRVNHSMIKNNGLRIQFQHPDTLQHKKIFNSDDSRNLGIAVNWIKIEPWQK